MLGQAGARLSLVELLPERTEAVAREGAGHGYDVEAITADVARPGEVDRAVQQTLARWDRLDVVVANAGISGDGLVAETDEAAWDRVLEVDLDGVFYTLRAAIPALKRSPHGRIVCTASHYGVIGKDGMANHAA